MYLLSLYCTMISDSGSSVYHASNWVPHPLPFPQDQPRIEQVRSLHPRMVSYPVLPILSGCDAARQFPTPSRPVFASAEQMGRYNGKSPITPTFFACAWWACLFGLPAVPCLVVVAGHAQARMRHSSPRYRGRYLATGRSKTPVLSNRNFRSRSGGRFDVPEHSCSRKRGSKSPTTPRGCAEHRLAKLRTKLRCPIQLFGSPPHAPLAIH